jgi:perosamine synthetase
MIPQYTPRMTGREAEAVKAVLDSGYINDGPVTAQFEQQFATYVGRKYGVAVPNCTSAIALALMACGAEPGDDVIVPDLTFIATANAARLAGCNVIFADVDEDTFCIEAETVAAVRTPRAKFVIAVEVNGRSPDYPALLGSLIETIYNDDVTLITDSCEALGSCVQLSSTRSLRCGKFGDASCFSFSPNKMITTGQGGMVVTDSDEICLRLRQLKYQGLDVPGGSGNIIHPTLGFNFKFTDIQAAIGIEQLKALPERIIGCQQRDQWYREALPSFGAFPSIPQHGCLWMADILVDDQASLAAHLRANDIGVREFWLPLHRQPPHAPSAMAQPHFPVADSLFKRGLWLPSSYDITQAEVGQVADCINRWEQDNAKNA